MSTPLDSLVRTIDEDGFVILREHFDAASAERARQELDALFDGDATEKNVWSNLTVHYHLAGKSPALDALFERLLADPKMAGLLQAIGGKNLKFKHVIARRTTGEVDHGAEGGQVLGWHRDEPSDFTISILLSDIDDDGPATGVVRGSHKWLSDPVTDCMFSSWYFATPDRRRPGVRFLSRCNPFARLLWKRKIADRVDAIGGKQGDIYVFTNATWHRRMINWRRSKGIVVLASLAPSETVFDRPDYRYPPETIRRLPPHFARMIGEVRPANQPADTLLARMVAARKKPRPFSLFWLARVERRALNGLSRVLQAAVVPPVRAVQGFYRAVAARRARATS
jgi:hypothetical protein